MRPSRILLLVVAVLVVAALGSCGFWAYNTFTGLSAKFAPAKAFVASATSELVPKWELATFTRLATSDFAKTLEAAGDGALQRYRVLGALAEPLTCADTSMKVSSSTGTTAILTCKAKFASGPATLTYSLKQMMDESWRISDLKVQL